jgi:hypothetical protein
MVRPASLLEPRRPKTFPAHTSHQEAKTTTTSNQHAETRHVSLQTWHQGVGKVGKRGYNNGWCGWESRGGGGGRTDAICDKKFPTFTPTHPITNSSSHRTYRSVPSATAATWEGA